MKNTFTLFLFIISMIGLRAQEIPGYNFENWIDGDTLAPFGWQTYGSNQNGFNAVSKSTDHYEGSFSVKLAIMIHPGQDTTVGHLESKRADGTEGLSAAFPVSSAHTSLTGFYKYIPVAGDSAQIIAPLFKSGYANPLGFGNILAMSYTTLGAAATFTPFSANFTYFASLVPDSGYVSLDPFKEIDVTNPNNKLVPHGNSILYIDALNYDTYITTGINSKTDITNSFALYPSISSGSIHVNFETLTTDFTTIKVYDLTAREVKNLYAGQLNAGMQHFDFNLTEVPNGNYLFVVATEKGYRAEQFSITK